jgi:hypothetical protein
MKTKCVFIKDAGRRIDKKSVAWYDVSFAELVGNYFNTGDLAVYDSTLKLLDYRRSARINIDLPVDHAVAKTIEKSYEFLVLRASNYIHEEMDWGFFPDWLEAIRLPVLCMGVGAQAAEKRKIQLPAAGKRVWDMISERSPSIGVRGAFTAGVLEDNQIKNAEIVGCPTMFRSCTPTLALRHKSYEEISRVAFSLRREIGENYTSDVGAFLDVQKKWILRLHERFNLTLTTHGEVEEKAYFYNDGLRLAEARQELVRSGWFDPDNGPQLERIYAHQLYFSPVVSYYDELVRNMDFTIGYRVHGVLPALAAGTPSILLQYDARSGELAETFKVPLLNPRDALNDDLRNIFHRQRFSEFELNYPLAYQNMKNFLEKHEVAHCM